MRRKPSLLLLLLLLALAAVSAYLLSRPSIVGRIGIDLFYKEYAFLKTGWKTFLYMVVLYGLIYGVLVFASGRQISSGRKTALIILLLGLAGAVYTYYDFRHTVSHRLLGGRFHLGAYLFWAGWLMLPLYFIWRPQAEQPPA